MVRNALLESRPPPGLSGPANERQQAILERARITGRVLVDEIASRFEVTPQTVRKDLNELCQQRLMTRVHGGAVLASGVTNLAYQARRFVAQPEKEAIGIAAARRIPSRASLFINIGTTNEEVAKALVDHEDLLVITNNLHVAALLYPNPRIEVIVAGGPVRRSDGAVVGEAAVQLIQQFKVDFAVIGASAIDASGELLDFDYREVRVSRAIIENARAVVLVADAMKFERTAPIRVGHMSDIDLFVTDALPGDAEHTLCREFGVEVVEAARRPSLG